MFFNTRKKKEKEKAKELADAILNTFKTGLFNTKYHKTAGQFTLPPNIFKDIYISGFVEHFISLNLNYFYKEIKTSSSNADFLFDVYRNLGLNKDEIELYSHLLTNEKIRKDWDAADGRYTLGKEHARLCFCCMFNIFTIEENSELFPKAKEIAKKMPNIIGNETFEVKLITAMCELTIYDYLQKHFGGVLIGKHDNLTEI